MRLMDIINGPWAITPAMLNEIRSGYAKHMRGEKIDKETIAQLAAASGAKKQQQGDRGYTVENGTAVIPVEGVIAKKMNLFMALCGGASTQMTERAIRQALADDSVSQIMLYIDSPGGTVDGTFELSNFIYENRGKKPIIAFSDGAMYSAAYAIGSAADSVYISSDAAGVGSIGVVAAHEDISRMEEMMGVKTTEIYSGKYKRIASSYKPLSDEGRAAIQDEVDHLYSVFVDTVARNRGVTSEDVLQNMSTDVKSAFMGRQAVEAGLVDGVATMEQVMAGRMPMNPRRMMPGAAGAAADSSAAGDPAIGGAQEPTAEAGAPQAEKENEVMDMKELQEKHPDLYKAVFDEGAKAGSAAELERVKAVKAVAMPGHEALVEQMMFDGKTSGAEAAVQVIKAENDKRAKHLDAFKADGKDVKVPVVDGAAADAAAASKAAKPEDKTLPVEERAKASWDADAAVRAEFGAYEVYLSWYKANDAGQIKTIKK